MARRDIMMAAQKAHRPWRPRKGYLGQMDGSHHAHSPQAKGRVERLWGAFQDRLVTVRPDHTISFEGLTLQIPPSSRWASIAKQKVTVMRLQGRSMEVWYKQKCVLSLSSVKGKGLMKKYQIEKTELQNAA